MQHVSLDAQSSIEDRPSDAESGPQFLRRNLVVFILNLRQILLPIELLYNPYGKSLVQRCQADSQFHLTYCQRFQAVVLTRKSFDRAVSDEVRTWMQTEAT